MRQRTAEPSRRALSPAVGGQKKKGLTEIRTQGGRVKTFCVNRYTMRPSYLVKERKFSAYKYRFFSVRKWDTH